MNIASDGRTLADAERAIRAYEHPPEGDVLWGIEHFSALLADRAQPAQVRADALRFVVHFVVDVHQPLHVGLASDRGGNEIDVRYGTTVTNLHRFWDTDVIALRGLPAAALRAASCAAQVSLVAADVDATTAAAESLAARPRVYAGLTTAASASRSCRPRMFRDAQALTERRLVQAAERLAGRLNRLFC